ncbi:MYG1 family protein [Vibrio sp. D431a]|uniref:MYG1 family protein n=1 Tax=Vibrio sp. D431a TaxID=2837388 RepID=UPI00255723D4|nr:MYG1 family protein [Vibrio sp. D431a]MDK9793894.1 MYG1 family protein [Vibrio sp. D431a]
MTVKIITHSGSFHADEIFATALIKRFYNSNVEVIRTREDSILSEAVQDPNIWVVDVGRSYNERRRNFDHHQASFSKKWSKTEIPFSSCGLVWSYLKKKGFLSKKLSDGEVKIIEDKLIIPIDKHDNRVATWPQSVMFKLANRNKNTIEDFHRALTIAEIHLEDTIYYAKQTELNIQRIKDVEFIENGLVAVVGEEIHNMINPLANNTDAKVVIMPKTKDGDISNITWAIRSLPSEKEGVLAPKEWRGLSSIELQEMSGLKSLDFTHKSGFLTIAKNRKDAEKVARLMLSNGGY